MDAVIRISDFFLHVDVHLSALAERFGEWVYGILFAIVFAETGLVVTPFLPGDSLLFAAGTLAGAGVLEPVVLAATLLAAAIIGDAVNYVVGRYFGRRLLSKPRRFIRPEHIARTEAFYERHGGKTIILARFVPFARTFAPFVAGVAHMHPGRFFFFNVSGAILWVGIFVGGGVWFGNVPWVKDNLTLVLVGVVLASLAPGLVSLARRRLRAARETA
jgi:membrane-associated protein